MASDNASFQHDPIGRITYDRIGTQYSAAVDTKPHNAYYERPATLSLLPAVEGLHVLDAGSGNGWYAEYLVSHGALVTACDVSPVMVQHTQARVREHASVYVADLAQPLDFAHDQTFDLVLAPLVLHYLEHWEPTLTEFHRILRLHGTLVFSTHHPTADYQHHPASTYFATQLVEEEWAGLGRVQFYRRPMSAIVNALTQSGFCIERMLEPQPTPEYQQVHPSGYEELMSFPHFVVIRARSL
ncbi:MAG: class I SAM-dependent methyltransferase [Chloroflexota bacterium]|nr:class I SAM-dependent methyltransferase [Chloroflexota bacterium]